MALVWQENARAATKAPGKPLYEYNFRPVARNGFSDPGNAYCHAMQWFRDHLYIGVTRHTLCGSTPYDRGKEMQIWPVKVPDITWAVDWRAQIWRFDPRSGKLENVRIAPMAMGDRGFPVPRQIGYREMRAFQGLSDSAPALYAISWGSHMGPGPHVLRCADGRNFEETTLEDPELFGDKTLRPLAVFRDQLFTATAGLVGGTDPDQRGGIILASKDPAAGCWFQASETNFGDHKNVTMFELEVFNGYLYAGTMNPYEGLQLWKTDADGKPPYRWTRVLARGAGRGKLNELACSFCTFNGALYLGTAIYNCGYDRTYNVGPARPELIRVYPDDSWDLVVGEPRYTDRRLRVPTSGMGSGFDNPFCGYIWRLCAHDGWLYAGTCVWSPWLQFAGRQRWSDDIKRLFTPDFEDRFLQEHGGFDLWRSRDGDSWEPVTQNGFGNRFNCGARTMISTPHGLFVGVVNQFGTKVGVRRAAGWRYEFNQSGGVELWLGSHKPLDANTDIISLEAAPARKPDRPYVIRTGSDEDQVLDEFYGYTGWRLCGFWRADILDAAHACRNLIEEVLAFTTPDEKLKAPCHPDDDVLDAWIATNPQRPWEQCDAVTIPPPAKQDVLLIGCGLGATMRYLKKHFVPQGLLGVSNNRGELRVCRQYSPDLKFMYCKLPKLKIRRRTFDKVICLEGPGRYGPRQTLLREILRVLRPGGQLVGSDVFPADADPEDLPDLDAYRQRLECIGFDRVRIVDVTEQCANVFRSKLSMFVWEKTIADQIDADTIDGIQGALPYGRSPIAKYVLLSAHKKETR